MGASSLNSTMCFLSGKKKNGLRFVQFRKMTTERSVTHKIPQTNKHTRLYRYETLEKGKAMIKDIKIIVQQVLGKYGVLNIK